MRHLTRIIFWWLAVPLLVITVLGAISYIRIPRMIPPVGEVSNPSLSGVLTSLRNLFVPLFGKKTIALSLLQGLGVFTIIFVIFAVKLYRGQGELDARTLTFTTLMITNLSLILTNRSWSRTLVSTLKYRNRVLWMVVFGGLVFLALVLYVPFLRGLFRFSALHPADLLLCFSAGPAGIPASLQLQPGRVPGASTVAQVRALDLFKYGDGALLGCRSESVASLQRVAKKDIAPPNVVVDPKKLAWPVVKRCIATNQINNVSHPLRIQSGNCPVVH